jgi:hypothetical protein
MRARVSAHSRLPPWWRRPAKFKPPPCDGCQACDMAAKILNAKAGADTFPLAEQAPGIPLTKRPSMIGSLEWRACDVINVRNPDTTTTVRTDNTRRRRQHKGLGAALAWPWRRRAGPSAARLADQRHTRRNTGVRLTRAVVVAVDFAYKRRRW